MVLPQHETKKPKYARWVFLSGHISKINQRTKHVESLKTRRLDEGSNPSDSTKKALRKRAFLLERFTDHEIKVPAFGAVAIVEADVESFGWVYNEAQASAD
ncbi:MAG: hypothetical protein RL164_1141 [Bacteroidota bacterium]|jgi:hypothetical protein